MGQFQTRTYAVERVVLVFSSRTEELMAEHPLSSFDLSKFKRHFGAPDEDEDIEMVCDYEVAPKDVDFLSTYLPDEVEFDFEKYTYFLSCYRADN